MIFQRASKRARKTLRISSTNLKHFPHFDVDWILAGNRGISKNIKIDD
jgi:hypothetical protein